MPTCVRREHCVHPSRGNQKRRTAALPSGGRQPRIGSSNTGATRKTSIGTPNSCVRSATRKPPSRLPSLATREVPSHDRPGAGARTMASTSVARGPVTPARRRRSLHLWAPGKSVPPSPRWGSKTRCLVYLTAQVGVGNTLSCVPDSPGGGRKHVVLRTRQPRWGSETRCLAYLTAQVWVEHPLSCKHSSRERSKT